MDPDRQTMTRVELEVQGSRLVRVGETVGGCVGATVDLGGRYVVPGFVDTHVHGWGNPSPGDEKDDEEWGRLQTAQLSLKAGVVAFLDMASEAEDWRARDRARASDDHAHIYSALMLSTGGRDERSARESLRSQLGLNPDIIKLFAGGEHIGAMVDEASRVKRSTVVHIASWEEAEAAVGAGATAITHLEDEVVIPFALAREMARRGTISIPTLSVQCDLHGAFSGQKWLSDPLLARVTGPKLLAAYRDRAAYSKKSRRTLRWQKAGCRTNDFRSIRILQKAGVSILAGSDTGNLGVFQGYGVHREMALLNEAGLSTWQALRAGTTAAARFLGHPAGIVPGGEATFVVLAGDPVKDIRNTSRIAMVVHRGRVVWDGGDSR